MPSWTHWIPSKEHVFLPGEAISGKEWNTPYGSIVIEDKLVGKLQEIQDPMDLEGVDDICASSSVSDATLLHCIRARFERDTIYTYISNILVAVNPFKTMSHYSNEEILKYSQSQTPQSLSPHIFGIGAMAFNSLIANRRNQAVLISGESGAGKTESTKHVLLYTAAQLRSASGLEDKLLMVNPILEAFGNAKTTRNDNSSRFGKWIQVDIDPVGMHINRASITDYLLEVTRVVHQGPDERNYHIFYGVTSEEARAELPELKLEKASAYKFTNRNTVHVANVNDDKDFLQFRLAISAMGISSAEELEICRIVGGILHLGNIEFDQENDAAFISNMEVLETVAEVMMIDQDTLKNSMIFKIRETRGEVFNSPLTAAQATHARDAMAKGIYGRLFKWLVSKSNKALGQEVGEGGSRSNFMGVLDIAGFETFKTNSLEQLSINLSNEKLQQFFNHAVFKTEREEYEAEGIPLTSIAFNDNQHILDLIEGVGGILRTLDDATTGVRLADDKLANKLRSDHKDKEMFVVPKFIKDQPLDFGIIHYAGEVTYTTRDWVTKNDAQGSIELIKVMASSQNSVLKALENPESVGDDVVTRRPDRHATTASGMTASPSGGSPGASPRLPTRGKDTVSSLFRKSLQSLIQNLNQAEASFVRCIKPNAQKVPSKFDADSAQEQLRFSGALETVKIRQAGFLKRLKFLEFARLFLFIGSKEERKEILKAAGSSASYFLSNDCDHRKAAEMVMELVRKKLPDHDLSESRMLAGKTKVFLKSDAYSEIERAKRIAITPDVIKVQKWARGWLIRKTVGEVLEVNQTLRECCILAGVGGLGKGSAMKDQLTRATFFENSLAKMDIALVRAMHFSIKLPRMSLYLQARARFAIQVNAARALREAAQTTDVIQIKAAVSSARSLAIAGKLLDSVQERGDLATQQYRMRQELQYISFSEVAADVEKVVADARKHGLEQAGNWILADGPEIWLAASQRIAMLTDESGAKDKGRNDAMERLSSAACSADAAEMEAALAIAEFYSIEDDATVALKERLEKLEEQIYLREELANGLLAGSQGVAATMERIAEQGLSKPEAWILRGAPRLAAAAVGKERGAKQKADAERIHKVDATVDMDNNPVPDQEVQMITFLADMPLGQRLFGDFFKDQLKGRAADIVKQAELRKRLQMASIFSPAEEVHQVLEEATSAGLDSEQNWVLPGGVNIFGAAKARQDKLNQTLAERKNIQDALVARISTVQASSDTVAMKRLHAECQAYGLSGDVIDALAERVSRLMRVMPFREALVNASVNNDPEILNKVLSDIAEAKMNDDLSLWESSDGSNLLTMGQERFKVLADRIAMHKRLAELAANGSDISEVKAVLAECESLGLDKAEAWNMADGPSCLAATRQKLKELETKAESQKFAAAELEQVMSDALASVDIQKVKIAHFQANTLELDSEKSRQLAERFTTLTQQSDLVDELKAVAFSSDIGPVEQTMQKVKDLGLEDGSKWLIEDGPAHVKRACSWLAKLQDNSTTGPIQFVELMIVAAQSSMDASMIDNIVQEAEKLGISNEALDKLRVRSEALKRQRPVYKDLFNLHHTLKGVEEQVSAATEAGLADPQDSMFPAGPMMCQRALQYKAMLDNLSARAGVELPQHDQKDWKELQDAITSANRADIEKALESWNTRAVSESSAWRAKGGRDLVSLVQHRLDCFQERELDVDNHAGDVDFFLRLVTTLLASDRAQDLLTPAVFQKFGELAKTLETQLMTRESLVLCIFDNNLERVKARLQQAERCKLNDPKMCFLPDAPRIFNMAQVWATQVEAQASREKHLLETLSNNISQALLDSHSVPDMLVLESKATRCKADTVLIQSLQERCAKCKTQTTVLAKLRAISMSKDIAEIEAALFECDKAGLLQPKNWILPDGPRYLARAAHQKDQAQTLAKIESDIGPAKEVWDVAVLHQLLTQAVELAVHGTYEPALSVFLQMQDTRWLPEQAEYMAGVTDQDAVTSKKFSNVLKMMKDKGMDIESDIGKKAALKADVNTSNAIFEDMANFANLRSPMSFTMKFSAIDLQNLHKDMLSFSVTQIQNSLTDLSSELEEAAKTVFTDVLRCMGDIPGGQNLDLEVTILSVAAKDPALGDEIYLQLVKQLTDNPSVGSATQGWILMQMLVDAHPPSTMLEPFLRAFLIKAASFRPNDEEISKLMQKKEKRVNTEGLAKSALEELEARQKQGKWKFSNFCSKVQPKLAADTLSKLQKARGDVNRPASPTANA